MPINAALLANPQLFGAYQQDPSVAYGQALMQQGASTAPVRSPLEGLARALTAGVGGFTQSKAREGYEGQAAQYQKGLSAALQGNDIVAALSQSKDPMLQQQGLNLQLQLAQDKLKSKAQLANDLLAKGLVLNPDGSIGQAQGYGPAMGGIKNDELMASIPGEVAKGNALIGVDVNKQQALMPGEIDKARLQAQATAPIEQAKAIATYNATQGPQNKFANTDKLRDDFRNDPNVKNYQTVVPIYKSMVEASKTNTRAADLNLVYGMAKIFDPTSVVREGEQVLVNNTQSLPSQLVGMINQLNGGQGLQPEARAALLAQAKSRVDQAEGLYNQTKDFFSQTATQSNIDPKQVFFDVGTTPAAPGPGVGGGAGGPPKIKVWNPQTQKMEEQ